MHIRVAKKVIFFLTMAKIELRKLSVTYKNKKTKEETVALKEMSEVFDDSSFNVIVGPSGSGKTTLLKAIAGLVMIEGDILIDDVDVSSLSPSLRQVAYVSQEYILYPHMTVFDNIAFPLKAVKASKEEIIEQIADISNSLGLRHLWSRKPKELSGGQQQRIALARAIAKKPSIYLFDEPLSNLASDMREEERKLIKEVSKKYGATSLYVTHSMKEAFAIADNIIVINEGKVVARGSVEEIRHSLEPTIRGMINAEFNSL